jgi:hypothetical protein
MSKLQQFSALAEKTAFFSASADHTYMLRSPQQGKPT